MKVYRVVLEPAKGALILFALSVILAFALVAGLARYRGTKEGALTQAEGALQAASSEIQTLTFDLAFIETHLASFNHLTSIGLIGDPDREAWVQGLEAIYNELRLPPTLHYALAPPQSLAEDPTATTDNVPASPTNALRHDLDLELSGIHEEEFLSFIGMLYTDWQTPFRIETCRMEREPETGLKINCTLRLFSLPLATIGQ